MLIAPLLLGLLLGPFPGKKDKHAPPPAPIQRIPLADLGMHGRPTAHQLDTLRAFATLNFIDDERVLLTFPVAAAMPRDDVGEVHSDRQVRAEIIDLATGQVALTHDITLHDRAAYLWPLGDGNFLLRSGGSLFQLNDKLETTLLVQGDSPLPWVQSNPNANLFVEITQRERHTTDEHARLLHESLLHNAPDPTEDEDALGFRISPARQEVFHGKVAMAGPIAATDEFWLHAEPSGGTKYEIWLEPWNHAVEKQQIGKVSSECHPQLQVITAGVVVALTCSGDGQKLVGFQLETDTDGKRHSHEAWTLREDSVARHEGMQPAASPDVLLVALLNSVPDSEQTPAAGRLQVVDCGGGVPRLELPMHVFYGVARTADVSPDGKQLAVLRDGALEIFNLPKPVPPAKPHKK